MCVHLSETLFLSQKCNIFFLPSHILANHPHPLWFAPLFKIGRVKSVSDYKPPNLICHRTHILLPSKSEILYRPSSSSFFSTFRSRSSPPWMEPPSSRDLSLVDFWPSLKTPDSNADSGDGDDCHLLKHQQRNISISSAAQSPPVGRVAGFGNRWIGDNKRILRF